MKNVLKRTSALNWLDQNIGRSDKKSNIYVVPRSLYQEHRRTYKATALELLRLIRNESKVYGRSGNTVVWRCRQLGSNNFTVLFAVLDQEVNESLRKGWQIVLPETWLLYPLLNRDMLYRVRSGDDYWAWLKQDQTLHITTIKGLMQQPQYFLDAIGVPAHGVQAETLDFRSLSEVPKSAINAFDYLGLSVWHKTGAAKQPDVPWRKLAIFAGGLLLVYAGLLSAGLVYHEQRLNDQVATLQAQANEVFVRQRELEEQMSVLTSYQEYFERFPSAAYLLSRVSEQLQGKAVVRTIQLSGPQLQISGTADSATEVFSILSANPDWAEVRFDRNIQRSKDQEVFTLSMVHKKEQNQEGSSQ